MTYLMLMCGACAKPKAHRIHCELPAPRHDEDTRNVARLVRGQCAGCGRWRVASVRERRIKIGNRRKRVLVLMKGVA